MQTLTKVGIGAAVALVALWVDAHVIGIGLHAINPLTPKAPPIPLFEGMGVSMDLSRVPGSGSSAIVPGRVVRQAFAADHSQAYDVMVTEGALLGNVYRFVPREALS